MDAIQYLYIVAMWYHNFLPWQLLPTVIFDMLWVYVYVQRSQWTMLWLWYKGAPIDITYSNNIGYVTKISFIEYGYQNQKVLLFEPTQLQNHTNIGFKIKPKTNPIIIYTYRWNYFVLHKHWSHFEFFWSRYFGFILMTINIRLCLTHVC